MIRMFQSQTAGHAKSYFKASLSRADYYIEDQEHPGSFHGKVAGRLGLEHNQVDQKVFDQLCDNINPKTGGNLTPRTTDNRRVGYDISFHCPKSVSILHALGTDSRVLDAFKDSVQDTMEEIEVDVQTRVRAQGEYADRDTGELIWADFVHETARPVEGHAPDPHLHCHCFVFNTTYDSQEERFKAGQFHNIKQDMPYYQARFQKRLADRMASMGYDIRKNGNDYDLAMVPKAAIDHFSKRTNHIGQIAKDQNITNPKELDQIGARSRAKKQKNLTMAQLRSQWRTQLKNAGIDEMAPEQAKTAIRTMTAKECVNHSLNHNYSRASVRRERQLLATAYLHGIDNRQITMDEIDRSLAKDDRVFTIQDGKHQLCTTALVWDEEKRMVQLASDGKGKLRPLNLGVDAKEEYSHKGLSLEQQRAVDHIMGSMDRLTMIRGGAGTGKTTLIKSAVASIEKTGQCVHLFAPTSDASRNTLRAEGFENADTLASLLRNPDKQEEIKNQVIWVDEAGMLGTEDMADLLDLATTNKARLILSGDPRQHTAVQRGDAMRILQQVGRVPYVSLDTIYRQKVDAYKDTVEAISRGNLGDGFNRLDQMKAIQELDSDEIKEHLVNDYLKTVKEKKSALIISPTNQQGKQVTADIRKGLKAAGRLNKIDKHYTTFRNLHLTQAQKADHRVYDPGQIIQLHQNIPGAKRGSKLQVLGANEGSVQTRDQDGHLIDIPLSRGKDFDVYLREETPITRGDQIRITKNGMDDQGKRLDNGWILDVRGFTADGGIKVAKQSQTRSTEYILPKDHGNFTHAYCMTSYGAQGKTVDKVFVVQPAATFAATNQKQFYVSISRAREELKIYTDDKEGLLLQAAQSGDRTSALEIKSDDSSDPEFNLSPDYLRDNDKPKSPQKDIDHGKEPEI
ncbi:MobF family relaxase [Cyclobacterium sp. SYSU L10401]|uniref:MobF family relaxase n=1 Tax=Cyclobacterium sp. SYSU L10401 TaxID=2678657 RepID=UPI0013D8A4BD|nr:MobF family relaxase [Cyclobacterium sp. SYSU L10401]